MSINEKQIRFNRSLVRLMSFAQHCLKIEVVLKHVLRSREEQARLVKKGASRTMNSRHLLGLAADLVVFRNLDDDPELEPDWNIQSYQKLGTYWKSLGDDHVWGGDWPGLVDAGHFEITP